MRYVLCPDGTEPTGGIKVLYRHVDVMNELGLDAVIVHEAPEHKVDWFEHSTPTTSWGAISPTPDDWLVFPEVSASLLLERAPGVPKIIFNQSGSLTFHGRSFREQPSLAYLHEDVVAIFVISSYVERYMRYAFPHMRLMRVQWSIDSEVFSYRPDKRPVIAYMPRKHPEEIEQVLSLLAARGTLRGLEAVPIDAMSESEVADLLGEALFFLSSGYPEGLPLPPAEAMARGCLVVGYRGWGGADYFDDTVGFPVPEGDVLAFAAALEYAVSLGLGVSEHVQDMGRRASQAVLRRFSREAERLSIREAWHALEGQRGRVRDHEEEDSIHS